MDRSDYESEYHARMRDYDRATTDQERDAALMLAYWALINLVDKIDDLRVDLRARLDVTP
jgi:hypothetical protein